MKLPPGSLIFLNEGEFLVPKNYNFTKIDKEKSEASNLRLVI